MLTQKIPKVEPMHPADIQAALKKKGVTQRAIAGELEVSDVTINNVISGRGTSRRIANLIARLIDKDVEEIWPGRYK